MIIQITRGFSLPLKSAESSGRATIDWAVAFGIPKDLMSDGLSHFMNVTIRLLSKDLKVPHDFMLLHSPSSHGTVEPLEKELLWTFRSVSSELEINPEEWPYLLPVVRNALNNSPSPKGGNISPCTGFTEPDASAPILTFLRAYIYAGVSLKDT